jgi:hypothetical protein
VTVDFIGYHQDGSTVTSMVTTDGIHDGGGPLADFQTFTFEGFTDVVRVEMPNSPYSVDTPYSMDNLIIEVPEPASGSLLLLGGRPFYAIWQRREKMRT